jgi:hypothetical protein
MLERQIAPKKAAEAETSTIILRRVIPHALTIRIADKLLGDGLSEEGHKKLRKVLKKILSQEPVQASSEIPPVYEGAHFTFSTEGQENIPTSGTTLFIGNHTKSGPLAGMGQYFEASKIAYERRVDVVDDHKREPRAIAQKGLTGVFKFPGGARLVWTLPLTEQFYEMAAKSFNWIVVSAPKFDKNNQIINKQNLPLNTIDSFVGGEAMFWFPQGKHMATDDLVMPQKGTGLLTRLKDEDVKIVPVRFTPDGNTFRIRFGKPVHVQDIQPNSSGQLDVNDFARNYLQPLANR